MNNLIKKAKEFSSAAEFIRDFYVSEWSNELAFGYKKAFSQ